MKLSKDYAKAGGKICPGCESDRIVIDGLETSYPNRIHKPLRCRECGTGWAEVYRLDGYVDLDPGPELTALDNKQEDEA